MYCAPSTVSSPHYTDEFKIKLKDHTKHFQVLKKVHGACNAQHSMSSDSTGSIESAVHLKCSIGSRVNDVGIETGFSSASQVIPSQMRRTARLFFVWDESTGATLLLLERCIPVGPWLISPRYTTDLLVLPRTSLALAPQHCSRMH